jgi:hypothetical protein
VFIRGYFLHFSFVPEPVRHSFCEGGWLCGYGSIMQNKPNFRSNKMNTTFLLTKYYENKRLCRRGENKPNQTQPVVSAVESTCSELVEPISMTCFVSIPHLEKALV